MRVGLMSRAVLSPPVDLSESSYSHAQDKLLEMMSKATWFSDPKYRHGSAFYSLRVPSQGMGLALVLRMHENFYIEPSCTYGEDEWSLHARIWDDKAREFTELAVWSAGA